MRKQVCFFGNFLGSPLYSDLDFILFNPFTHEHFRLCLLFFESVLLGKAKKIYSEPLTNNFKFGSSAALEF